MARVAATAWGAGMRRTREEALATREAILDAGELVFFEQGVARTSLEQVARAAGVTRGAIYWHFQNKVDLLNAVVERVRMPLEHTLHEVTEGAGTLKDLERLCADALARTHSDARLRRVYTVLLLRCEFGEDMAGLAEREQVVRGQVTLTLTRFFERLRDTGPLAGDTDPRILAFALHAYMLGLFTDSLSSPERYRMPDDARRLVRHFFAPLDACA